MYGAKISVSTKEVLTETDPNNLIFDSELNTFKILAKGTYSPTLADAGTTEQTTSLGHGTGITSPFVIAFCKFENSRVGLPGSKASNASFWFSNLKSDGSNIKFLYINDTGGDYHPVFTYYICETPT